MRVFLSQNCGNLGWGKIFSVAIDIHVCAVSIRCFCSLSAYIVTRKAIIEAVEARIVINN